MAHWFETYREELWSVGAITLALVLGLLAHGLIVRVFARMARAGDQVLGASLARHLSAPLRLLLPIVAVRLCLPAAYVQLPGPLLNPLELTLSSLAILCGAWLLIRATAVLEDWLLSRYDIGAKDNLSARKIATQMGIMRKILVFLVAVLAMAAVLMNFDHFRQVGAGLLASAGVAGLIIGFAAQRTIANILAGFQIALTQPIRIDDVVIVEDEWGRIEEITLTYVVVRIWDLRRLVLPISYFIEKPFQNWTRQNAEILGSVFIHVDYSLPIDELREFIGQTIESSSYYNGTVWRLHVTEAGERSVQLRALMSANSSPESWELRCEVREKIITHLQQHYPDCLPRVRAELTEPVKQPVFGESVLCGRGGSDSPSR